MIPRSALLVLLVLAACSSVPAAAPASPPAASATALAPAPSAIPEAVATADVAEPPPVSAPLAALTSAGLASRHAADIVRSLTDEVGPRLAGSPGDRAAVAWALRAMQAEGLARVHAEAVRVPRWERGVETGAIVAPFPQKLALTALGSSVGTPANGVEGDVVEVASVSALDALEASAVAGKIVFINAQTERTHDGSGYGRAVSARSRGGPHAASRGALAVVIRSIGTGSDRAPHTGNMRRAERGGREIPAAALSGPDADLLHRALSQKKPVRLRMTLGCRWRPDADSANVVGEIPGTSRAGEIVLLGAHLDSWDLGTGAVDDGAGVGVVLEAARLLLAAGIRPERTLRIVLFANEENGLAGAKQYAKVHAAELPKHIVALEADLGSDRVFDARFVGATERRAAFAALVKPLLPLGIARSDVESDGGSDLYPMREAGVPTIFLHQDATRYFDVHHSANDTFDKIDSEALAQVATAFALVAHGALGMEGDLGRIPEDKRSDD